MYTLSAQCKRYDGKNRASYLLMSLAIPHPSNGLRACGPRYSPTTRYVETGRLVRWEAMFEVGQENHRHWVLVISVATDFQDLFLFPNGAHSVVPRLASLVLTQECESESKFHKILRSYVST